MNYEQKKKAVEEAVDEFPAVFGAREFPGERFRINRENSIWDEAGDEPRLALELFSVPERRWIAHNYCGLAVAREGVVEGPRPSIKEVQARVEVAKIVKKAQARVSAAKIVTDEIKPDGSNLSPEERERWHRGDKRSVSTAEIGNFHDLVEAMHEVDGPSLLAGGKIEESPIGITEVTIGKLDPEEIFPPIKEKPSAINEPETLSERLGPDGAERGDDEVPPLPPCPHIPTIEVGEDGRIDGKVIEP